MAPVPPPPPSNIPTFAPAKSNSKPSGIPNTSALLKSIEKGAKLKKTETNDRSTPVVSNQPNSTAPNEVSHSSSTTNPSANINSFSAGLGGLFANGFPALRTTKNASETKISRESSTPSLSKNPIKKVVEKVSDSISRHPEKAVDISNNGLKLVSSTVVSQAKKQEDKMVGTIIKASAFGSQKSNERSFPIADDNNLPIPGKFIGFKKIYLSKNLKIEPKLSKSYSGSSVSEEHIEEFIESLKSKLKKAADDENFEECLRLKTKLKSFQDIEKRIKSGEKISATELPK